MKTIKMKLLLAGLITFIACGSVLMNAATSSAIDVCGGGGSAVCGGSSDDVPKLVADLTGLLFFIIGVIAVIVIIVAGLKYVTADGDSSKIKGAKDTLLYAIIGLVVAMLSYAIVIFIVNAFS